MGSHAPEPQGRQSRPRHSKAPMRFVDEGPLLPVAGRRLASAKSGPAPGPMSRHLRYHHVGIPTTEKLKDEIHLAHLQIYVSGYRESPYGATKTTRHIRPC